ncbi:hypothetical protein ACGFZL_03870 [Streptomyces sp. NPDC048182]|uniref:hypothetical protein n=1 Tax=Streptomyces sp. NPDC048182 TaxID=3365507 RepID=UPI00370F8904
MPRPTHPRPLPGRRLTALAFGVAAAVAVTSCDGGGAGRGKSADASAKTTEAPAGLLTEQAAAKVVDTYQRVNNRANAGRDVVTDEFQGQALAVLDPKGKPRVTAVEYRMVDSH